MILRSKHLNACSRSVPEMVSFLVFLLLCGGNLVLEWELCLVVFHPIGLLELCETVVSEQVGASGVAATAGECKGYNGLLEVIESEFSAKSGAAAVAATVGSQTPHQAGVLHGTPSLFLNSRIHPHGHRSRIHGSSHFPHARARAVAAAALPAGAASRSATPVVATPARFSRSFADPASACATPVHDSAFISGRC